MTANSNADSSTSLSTDHVVDYADSESCQNGANQHRADDMVDWTSRLHRVRRSDNLLVWSVFIALMLDGILWTVVVPILPSYLRELETVHNSTSTHLTPRRLSDDGIPVSDEDQEVTTRQFELASDSFYEWVDGSSRPTDKQWLLDRWLWLHHNWTDSMQDLLNNSFSDEDIDGLLSSVGDHRPSDDEMDFQKEDGRIGMLLAAKALVQLICNPIVGMLVNRFGPSASLISGVFILLTSSTLYAVSTNYFWLLAARAIHGAGSSCIGIAGMSALAHNFPNEESRGRAMGVGLGGLGCGLLIGYPLGGLCSELNAELIPFIVIASASVLGLALQLWISSPLNFARLPISESQGDWAAYRLLLDPYILIATGALFIPELAMATLEPTIPTWVLDTMHPRKWMLGTVFVPDSIGYFIGCNVASLLLYRLGSWRIALGTLLLAGVCLFAIPFATEVIHLVGPHFGFGLALGAINASIQPLLARLVDTRHPTAAYGSVYSIAQNALCLGFFIGPLAGGHLVEVIGFKWLVRTLAIMHFVFAPLCCLLQDRSSVGENTTILTKPSRTCSSPKPTNSGIGEAKNRTFNYQPLH